MNLVVATTFPTSYIAIWVADNAGHLNKNGGNDTNIALH